MQWNSRKEIFCFFLSLALFGTVSGNTFNPSAQAVDKNCQGLRTFGRMYLAFGKLEEAHEYMSRSLSMAQKDEASEGELSLCLSDFAWVLKEKGNYHKAEELWLESLNIQCNHYGPEHPYVAYTLRSLSKIYLEAGDYPRAFENMKRSLDIMSLYHTENDPAMSPFLADMAKILTRQENLQDAAPLYQKAYETILQSYGYDHLYTAQFLCDYADFALKSNMIPSAQEFLEKSKDIYSKFSDNNLTNRICLRVTEAELHEAFQRYDEAEGLLLKALESVPEYLGTDPPHNGRIWMHLGRLYYEKGQYTNAKKSLQRALNCLADCPPESVLRAEIMYRTAQVKMQDQEYSEAETLCRNALIGIEKNLLSGHPLYIQVHDSIKKIDTLKHSSQAAVSINLTSSRGSAALQDPLPPGMN